MDNQGGKRSQTTQLVDLALERYRVGLADDGKPFAVELDGPNVALSLGDRAFRSALAAAYFERYDRAVSSSALADACRVLEGKAAQCPREPVALRVATYRGGVAFDLGDPEGKAVLINDGSWTIAERSPVLFRRTALTVAMPVPTRSLPIDVLFGLVNLATESRPLILAVLVASLIPDIPHPIVVLTGEQGTAKSTTARFLVRLIDRSASESRAAPRDITDWIVAAQAPGWCRSTTCRRFHHVCPTRCVGRRPATAWCAARCSRMTDSRCSRAGGS